MSSKSPSRRERLSLQQALLKAYKAINSSNYEDALIHSLEALSIDSTNYHAQVFQAKAQIKTANTINGLQGLWAASRLPQADDLVWRELRDHYRATNQTSSDAYFEILRNLIVVLEQQKDLPEKERARKERDNQGISQSIECYSSLRELSQIATKKNSDQEKWVLLLQVLTYDFVKEHDRTSKTPFLLTPGDAYLKLIDLTEKDDEDKIKKNFEARRTRLGATREGTMTEVRFETYEQSDLYKLCEAFLAWDITSYGTNIPNDNDQENQTFTESQRKQDEERHEVRTAVEIKVFTRAYHHLLVCPNKSPSKMKYQKTVLEQSAGMVQVDRPCLLAWDVHLEWQDPDELEHYDRSDLSQYCNIFPESPLTPILKPYLAYTQPGNQTSPKSAQASGLDEERDENGVEGAQLSRVPTQADLLVQFSGSISNTTTSLLAHRIVCAYFFQIEEYESAIENLRQALRLRTIESKKSCLPLQNAEIHLKSMLASSLIRYFPPRHHPEAKGLFKEILKHRPLHNLALLGIGLILEEDENYAEASEFLSKALERDPDNVQVSVEAAWCKALTGNLEYGLGELRSCLAKIQNLPSMAIIKSQTLYRIGQCEWKLFPEHAQRKDRSGPYAKFVEAIKANPNFAPAYTTMGIYFQDYSKNNEKRARACFQTAFDISPSEVIAAEKLARMFADKGDWDIVKIIAERVINTGNARPPPGSHKKPLSWPFAALGVVHMNRNEFSEAITNFHGALSIDPHDYDSYIGLGESYHNSGRYISALRTFCHAEATEIGQKLKDSNDNWFAQYMIGNVNRELGAFDEAITSYRYVLASRPKELGVHLALLQTLLEQASESIETGFNGRAIDCAKKAIDIACDIVKYKSDAFNLWKGVADACGIFASIQDRSQYLPVTQLLQILEHNADASAYDKFSDVDGVDSTKIEELKTLISQKEMPTCYSALMIGILAHKRGIETGSAETHTQAVAWYNLGLAEYMASERLEMRPNPITDVQGNSKTFLRASMKCFKRAIELESGNSEFWNSLGIATAKLNPQVSQHAFVRSLHKNERNCKVWTNLGALYMMNHNYKLAHHAFAKAQSVDPDYSHAWVGEGIIFLLSGNVDEALVHFTHAFEISKSATAIVKKELGKAVFDKLSTLESQDAIRVESLQPILALQQLRAIDGPDLPFDHLSALINERMGNYSTAIQLLTEVCTSLDTSFQETESPATAMLYAQAKSDLARNVLSHGDYTAALDEAQMALDLVESQPNAAMINLSAQLTQGLAYYFLKDIDKSLVAFREALVNTQLNPDVVCSLAQVLWAHGGAKERAVAREQLFETLNRQVEHTETLMLIGVLSTLENDAETAEAILSELEGCRMRSNMDTSSLDRIEKVLEILAETIDPTGANALVQMQRTTILKPYLPTGWVRLAQTGSDKKDDWKGNEAAAAAADMSVKIAECSVPPRGTMDAERLAGVLSKSGRVVDSLRGCMVAPWIEDSWIGLAGAVTAGTERLKLMK